MNIGIDGRAAKWYRGTGIGTYVHQLLLSLNHTYSKDMFTVFLPCGSSINKLNSRFNIEPVKSDLNANFWDEVSLPNSIENNNIELYHVPQNGVGLSKNISCKKMITLHDIIPLRMPETVSDRYLDIFNNKMPEIINNCDGIITVSNFSKEDIATEFNFPKEKIFVTHLAAENIYRPLNKFQCKEIIKKKYKIDTKFILYVGGLSPRKNIIGLIESYSLLKSKTRDQVKLVITGKKGLSFKQYLQRAIDLKVSADILFTDFISIEDLPLFYNSAQMLVYPSFYEGFGLPPLEAMACGTPVVTSNCTSLPEVCKNCAILINPHNTYALRDAIETVLSDKSISDKLSMLGGARSSQFSWNKTAVKTLAAYGTVLKNRP